MSPTASAATESVATTATDSRDFRIYALLPRMTVYRTQRAMIFDPTIAAKAKFFRQSSSDRPGSEQ
jgi:hypothetical protein